jgi:aminoglycoside 3-N-acetyltransferase
MHGRACENNRGKAAMKIYTKDDIVKSLKAVGLKKGDTVFSHSNIGFFGQLAGASYPADYGETFLSAFLEVIGDKGNICVPVFTYSFCKNQPFDPLTTPSEMGILAEYIRTHPSALRSIDSNFSVAVIGGNAKDLTQDVPEHSFGKNSFWDRLLGYGGKICNMNFDAGSTFLHYVEKDLSVPYRFDKAFYGKSLLNGKWTDKKYIHFVRHLDKPEWDTSMEKFDKLAREEGIVSETVLGRGSVILTSVKEVYLFIKEKVALNPYFLTVKGAI